MRDLPIRALARIGGVRIGFTQTRRTSRKSEATEVRGPPPRRSRRFTALDRRAPQAALHRVDFFGRLRAAENCFGRPSGRPRSFNGQVTDERRKTLTLVICCV